MEAASATTEVEGEIATTKEDDTKKDTKVIETVSATTEGEEEMATEYRSGIDTEVMKAVSVDSKDFRSGASQPTLRDVQRPFPSNRTAWNGFFSFLTQPTYSRGGPTVARSV
ncbi:hypothetical protein PoB_003307400 [Plakobranchus ocellatus]|uniref:Uncharacterized protein n=1 Tax=Plakobranchus ocellatus TaxID=259542 RepID=A0AAV4AK11_9GAST|nr:hypothetical protein PoB_003307400 [Plakobranchus ocellatus]